MVWGRSSSSRSPDKPLTREGPSLGSLCYVSTNLLIVLRVLTGTANLIRKLCLKLNCRRKVHSIVVNATFNVDVITGGSLMSVPLAG